MGVVFQAFHLIDELTAQENVELPAFLSRDARHGWPGAVRSELLDHVGLADRAATSPRPSPVDSSSAWLSPGRSPTNP